MEDWIAFATLIPLFMRIGFVHVILLYGTNNVEGFAYGDPLTLKDMRRRETASQLVLVSRILYCVM